MKPAPDSSSGPSWSRKKAATSASSRAAPPPARRESTPRRLRRAHRQDDAEIKYHRQNWYPGDAEGKGVFNFVTERNVCETRANQLDPGRNRLRRHLEVPELHPQRRWQRRRILLRGCDQQRPAGGHRHQDDHLGPTRIRPSFRRHLRRPQPEQLPWPRADGPPCRNAGTSPSVTPCSWPTRAARTFYVKSKHPTYLVEQNHHFTHRKDQIFYLQRGLTEASHRPDRQSTPRGPQQAPHGVRRGSAETPDHLPRRQRWRFLSCSKSTTSTPASATRTSSRD